MKKQVKRIVYVVLSFMLVLTGVLGVPMPASAAEVSPVTLSSLAAGNTVNFSGQTWIVLDPSTGYLLLQGSFGDTRIFDQDNTNSFDISYSNNNNIGYYLNNDFYNSLDSADRPLIQSHSWGIGNETNESSATEICNVGLISYSEWNKYGSITGSISSDFWFRTPGASGSDQVWYVAFTGSLSHVSGSGAAYAVRPTLYLKPDVLVSGGNGGIVLGGKYHTVSVSANLSAGGTVTGGGGAYANGESVPVTATAKSGYNFVNWIDQNGTQVSTEASYSSAMGTADTSLIANFQIIPMIPTITVVNGAQFSVTVQNTFGTLTGTNNTYGTLTGTASGNDTVISGTLTGVPTTWTEVTLNGSKVMIRSVTAPSTTVQNPSFY